MSSSRVIFALLMMMLFASHASRAQNAAGGNTYTFNPLAVKRDPFFPSELSTSKKSNDLLRFDLNEMNLVAILTGMGAPQAMIVLPNSKTHIVQVGDPIGRHQGKVARISATEVIVRETFTDYQNRKKTNLTNLVLAE